jgi:sterol desaturase/sphingolipid hydroxylase (fatty acid hydroxylase superfamily)
METYTLTLCAQRLAPIILLTYMVCIGIEMTISSMRARRLYELEDTIHNLVMFFANRMMGGLGAAFMLAVLATAEHIVPWKIGGPFAAVVTFLIVDFLFYVQHRFFHSDNVFAPFHEVHHTSPQYNLTTTLRASVFLPWINPIFYLPAVLVGCDSVSVIVSFSLIQVYQFFLHTQLVGSIGLFEGILNTPSAHRVHHGRERSQYESNLGGVLLLWDRLFRTYARETELLVFGIRGVQAEGNYFVAQVKPFFTYFKRRIVPILGKNEID